MKKFFAQSAAFTNNADLDKQNQDALDRFHTAVNNSISANGTAHA